MTWYEGLWQVLNSPAAITAVAAVALWLLNRLYAKKPLWQQFEGTIISAVKFAEKEIPPDTPNKALARLDIALGYVLSVFENVQGRRAVPEEQNELKEAIQAEHAALEATGKNL